MAPVNDGGLGSQIVGDRIQMGTRTMNITKLIGEGGFSYVYLVKELPEGSALSASLHIGAHKDKQQQQQGGGDDIPARRGSGTGNARPGEKPLLVVKVTSIHSRSQRDIAEKEAKLLSRLSHPSIVKMHDTCYQQVAHTGSTGKKGAPNAGKDRPQHLILMEYCEGGHALDVCAKLAGQGQRFDLSTLIIAFGQICNAVSYLHAQRPPIVHRDLKPNNFLVKNGAYKLCDFGSAVFGHVDLRTPKARAEAEEVIQKTTTQMFRAPEMVDLFTAKKLTQATDVWALGACLYSLAYLQNCFEEGSNLAILSNKYTIPEDNPYGEGLVELLDRMLCVDSKARADMTEVILCLSAVYSGRPLPPRKKSSKASKTEGAQEGDDAKTEEKIGTFRTDSQGYQETLYDPTKATEGKKLASNSVAARRKRAAASSASSSLPPTAPTPTTSAVSTATETPDPLAFSSFSEEKGGGDAGFGSEVGFGEMKGFDTSGKGDTGSSDFFGSFDDAAATKKGDANATDAFDAAFSTGAWGENAPSDSAPPADDAQEADPALAGSQDVSEGGVDPSGDDKKNDSPSDSQRKERSRRRRGAGGSSRTSSRPSNLEGGVEAITITDGAAAPAAEGEKKERRSRSTRTEDDKEHRRRRSGSRSKRKARPPRDAAGRTSEKPADAAAAGASADDKKNMKRGNSFRGMFNRKEQAPSEPES